MSSVPKKPIILFLVILFAVPYLISLLFKRQKPFEIGEDGLPVLPNAEKLEIAKAVHPFTGQNRNSLLTSLFLSSMSNQGD